MSQSRIIFIQRPPRPRPARSRAARPHATAALTDCKRETNLSRSGSRVGRSVPSSDSTSARAPARPRCFQMTRKKEGRVAEEWEEQSRVRAARVRSPSILLALRARVASRIACEGRRPRARNSHRPRLQDTQNTALFSQRLGMFLEV